MQVGIRQQLTIIHLSLTIPYSYANHTLFN